MRILIIQDEHKIAQACKQALEQENFKADVAYDGSTGYTMITTEPYDLAIVDRSISGKYDGLNIIKAVRKLKNHTPILILMKKGTAAERLIGLDAGADDYLFKPFGLEELIKKVKKLLHNSNEPIQTVLTADDLSMDTATCTVQRAGRKIKLSSKEFALLEYLLRHQVRPNSKEDIIAHVWGYNSDILINTVEVYMKYLRTKIDLPGSTPLVRTFRGFGYKIEAKK